MKEQLSLPVVAHVWSLGFDSLPGRPSLASQRDPVMHVHQRKPWNRAFSSVSLKEYEGILAKRARQLLSCIEDRIHRSGQKDGVVLDMAKWFSYFAYVLNMCPT